MNSEIEQATPIISIDQPGLELNAQIAAAPSSPLQDNTISTAVGTPASDTSNLPGLSVPKKNVTAQGYQSLKGQSENPFMAKQKSSKQRTQLGSSSIKLDRIDENITQGKSNLRLNRSTSPGINMNNQIKNNLNQQVVSSNSLKPANILTPSRQLKSAVSQYENKGEKLQPKGLSVTLKPLSSAGTLSLPIQQPNPKLQSIPELSKSVVFQNQRLFGSQVVLAPKVPSSNQQYMIDSRSAGQKKPQTSSASIGGNHNGATNSTNGSDNNQLKFYVGGGNNSERIRKLMAKREGWVETKDATSMFVHFKWQQSTRGYKYEKLVDNNNYKQVVNHFEFHHEISNKQYLVKNLMSYSEGTKQNVFDITPLTYVIDFNEENCDQILNNFLKFFETNMPAELKKKQQNLQSKANEIRRIMRQFQAQNGQQSSEKLFNQYHTRWSLQDTFLDQDSSTYMWLLKPTFLNRGRGIHVFNSLQLLEKLMSDYTAGFEEKMMKKQEPKQLEDQLSTQQNPSQNQDAKQSEENNNSNNNSGKENLQIQPTIQQQQNSQSSSTSQSTIPSSTTASEAKKISPTGNTFQIKKIKPLQQGTRGNSTSVLVKSVAPPVKKEKEDPNKYIRSIPAGPCILKASQFVVQKYIEKPLLINNRKFDIRVWALVSHNLDVYFFCEGYMRLSSSEFSTDENQLDNLFIHLTNNAIQKYSDSYGTFENGNMWTFDHLWNFLATYYKGQDEKQPAQFYKKKIVEKIKEIILITFSSVKKKLNQNDRKHCFEMFGFDFLIDAELNTWLIEVNTNPAIEECSAVTSALIPRALDDAFKLTIDLIFPRKQNQQQQGVSKPKEEQTGKDVSKQEIQGTIVEKDNNIAKDTQNNKEKSISGTESLLNSVKETTQSPSKENLEETFPIRGYEDNFNMWELLGNLRETSSVNVEAKKKYKQSK